MEHSLHMREPIALVRPRGAHRFEAFSPKLARRVMFYRRPSLDQWLLLETDPKVIAFCERPGYVMINGSRLLADFWVHYIGSQELVILSETEVDGSATVASCDRQDNELLIRFVAPAELAAARVWLDNWQRMLPYLVTNRGLVPPAQPEAIVRFLKQSRRLLDIEREFASTDPVLVRAAVFGLLHDGRASSYELQTQPLSLLTSFVATEAPL
jgi:hypothetical protein